jgi:hypothetical protein
MQLSEIEVRALNGMGEGDLRGTGWAAVPESCPPAIARKIAEHRAKQIGYQAAPVEMRESDARARLAEIGL